LIYLLPFYFEITIKSIVSLLIKVDIRRDFLKKLIVISNDKIIAKNFIYFYY